MLVQVFSDVQETVMETVSRLEAVETLVRAEEDAESLNSVDTASNTPSSLHLVALPRNRARPWLPPPPPDLCPHQQQGRWWPLVR